MPLSVTEEHINIVKRQKMWVREGRLETQSFLGFLSKARAGQGKQFRIYQLH